MRPLESDSWIEMLQKVCDGDVRDEGKEEQDAVMVGTMEKAAKTETGTLRGWRRRYFILDADNLQYFTSKGGDKKMVRVRRPSTTYQPRGVGRPSLWLRSTGGRDMSLLDADLLADAQKVVTTSKLGDLQRRFTQARKLNTLEAVDEFIAVAEEETNTESTVQLMRDAKAATHLERRKLLKDLELEAITVRHSTSLQCWIAPSKWTSTRTTSFSLIC